MQGCPPSVRYPMGVRFTLGDGIVHFVPRGHVFNSPLTQIPFKAIYVSYKSPRYTPFGYTGKGKGVAGGSGGGIPPRGPPPKRPDDSSSYSDSDPSDDEGQRKKKRLTSRKLLEKYMTTMVKDYQRKDRAEAPKPQGYKGDPEDLERFIRQLENVWALESHKYKKDITKIRYTANLLHRNTTDKHRDPVKWYV